MFRVGTGIVVVLLGIFFLYLGVRTSAVFFIHSFILSGIGIAILRNTHEDDIEEIIKERDS